MYKIIAFASLFFLICACSTTSSYKQKDKDMALESGEIILTTLFGATNHIPETKNLKVDFFGREKIRLSRKSKEEILKFSEYVLSFQDYEVSIEIYTSEEEFTAGKNNLDARIENIIKVLTKSGIDKDKIYLKGHPSFADIEMHYDESFGIIEAEIW